ncbi:MAG: aminotransferase DegT [Sphingobacteriales bacterium 50-39]|nr:LegC family aminotransferase [Sphingobacteriales bacterium]OJW56833.1 MAG: aminotransferase DegT [Sphingobacteriales bacterium 50-39]
MYSEIIDFIRATFHTPEGFIPLHEPRFTGNEKKYVLDTIDSTFVSSVGAYVTRCENMLTEITGAKYAIAVVNGTCALHMAVMLAGVKPGDEVITQPLTFVATANAISHAYATPHFVDVDEDTMGMSPEKLERHLSGVAILRDGGCYNKHTGRRIAACIPMHTFGLPLRIDLIAEVCEKYNIPLVEDAAESLGAFYKGRHTGTFGVLGTLSFNGNKTVTCGGGGAILINDEELAKKARHLTTTAKVPHPWAFVHDEVGYNYRMPNLNAALACAQLEQLTGFVENKRELAVIYKEFFEGRGIPFVSETEGARANYWLMTILLEDRIQRDNFLAFSNERKVMTRPAWQLMNTLPMYKDCPAGDLSSAQRLADRIVNIPSSVRIKK